MAINMDTYYDIPKEKPGYCQDPFIPIYTAYEEDIAEEVLHLYYQAKDIEKSGLKADFQLDLSDWIDTLKRDMMAYYRIGLVAWKIKLMRCWEKRFSSFAAFCSQALGRTAAWFNNHIRAATVVSRLINLGFDKLPHSVSQCLALYEILSNEYLSEVWQGILDKYEYSKITQQIIMEELMPLDQRPPQTKQIKIPIEQWEQIRELAANAGMKPEHFVKQLIKSYLPNETEEDQENEENEINNPKLKAAYLQNRAEGIDEPDYLDNVEKLQQEFKTRQLRDQQFREKNSNPFDKKCIKQTWGGIIRDS